MKKQETKQWCREAEKRTERTTTTTKKTKQAPSHTDTTEQRAEEKKWPPEEGRGVRNKVRKKTNIDTRREGRESHTCGLARTQRYFLRRGVGVRVKGGTATPPQTTVPGSDVRGNLHTGEKIIGH